MSDHVTYHKVCPDMNHDSCMNTGIVEDGVTFNNIEPADGYLTFVGRTTILDAVAELYGLTVNQVRDRLTREKTMVDNLRAENAKLVEDNKAMADLIDMMRGVLARLDEEGE